MHIADRDTRAAVEAVLQASRLVRELQVDVDGLPTLRKPDGTLVTAADLAVQALVAVHLRARLGDVSILGEEGAEALAETGAERVVAAVIEAVRRHAPDASQDEVLAAIGACDHDPGGTWWALDPIDGTNGFVRGRHCAVALALIDRGAPVLGVLGCPRLPADDAAIADGFDDRGLVAFARAGEGAWLLPADETTPEPRRIGRGRLRTDRAPRFCQSGAEGQRTSRRLDLIARAVGADPGWLRVDGQGKYVLIARGQAEAYVRLPRTGGLGEWIWDHAAGAVIAIEGGAVVSDVHGAGLDYTAGARLHANAGVICADRELHPALIDAIQRLGLLDE